MNHAARQTFVHLEPPKSSLPEVHLPGTELLALIRDAVSMVHKLPTNGEASLVDGKPCPPKSILTLLTYCYVHGIYGSLQIEEKIRTDETLRLAFSGCQPDHRLLSQFRHRQREAIQYCLKRVYWFIWVKYGVQRREFQLVIGEARGRRVRVSPGFSEKVETEVSDDLSRALFVDRMMAD